MGLMDILGMMLFGLIAGALARFLVPGRQSMGILATMLLGIVGSFLGGFLASVLWGGPALRTVGWIGSVIGAILIILIGTRMGNRKNH